MASKLSVTYATATRMRHKLLQALDDAGGQAAMLRRLAAAFDETDRRPVAGGASRRDHSAHGAASSKQATVDRIRVAACRTFARNGVDATRLADIAREAGVSAGIIHYYFRHKDDLLLAALNWAGEQIEGRLDEAADADTDPLHRLVTMLELSVPYEGLLRDELLLWLEVWLHARHRPTLIPESHKLSLTWHERMASAIEQAATKGSVTPVASAKDITLRLIAVANDFGFKTAVGYGAFQPSDVRRLLFDFAAEQLGIEPTKLETASDVIAAPPPNAVPASGRSG